MKDIGLQVLLESALETPSSGKFVPKILTFSGAEMVLLSRHVDGHDYMWAISEMIDRAKEVIFILVCAILTTRLRASSSETGLVAYS